MTHSVDKQKPVLTMSSSYIGARGASDNDPLCYWLSRLPWNDEQRQHVDKTIKNYLIGHSRDGFTIFWQVDEQGNLHTGRMVFYQYTESAVRATATDWIHNRLNNVGKIDLQQYRVETVLYGLHLLNFYPDMNVNIVSGEKSAIECAIFSGLEQGLWMACDEETALNKDMLQPLIDQRRDIDLFPTPELAESWSQLAEATGYGRIYIADIYAGTSRGIVQRLHDQQEHEHQCKVDETSHTIQKMCEMNPFLTQLIDKLQLEPIID